MVKEQLRAAAADKHDRIIVAAVDLVKHQFRHNMTTP